jgi:hypothetical protein
MSLPIPFQNWFTCRKDMLTPVALLCDLHSLLLCSAQTTLQLASNSAHKALATLSAKRCPSAHLHLRCELATLHLAACEWLESPTLRASTLQAAVRCLLEGREALWGAWGTEAAREAAEKAVSESLGQALRGWTQVCAIVMAQFTNDSLWYLKDVP